MQLGPAEILVVLVIALLVFGPHKLPEVGRQVGRAYREVRRFQRTLSSEMHDVFADDASGDAAPAPTLPPRAERPDPDGSVGDDEPVDPAAADSSGEPAAGDAPAER